MEGQMQGRPVAIAPANHSPTSLGANGGDQSQQPTMPYSCQACAKRKVKCGKEAPVCNGCRKRRLECLYQAPAPRQRKRRASGDVLEKLAQYERILQDNGLLPDGDEVTPPSHGPAGADRKDPIHMQWHGPETSKTGKVVTDNDGKSRYIDSHLWRHFGEELDPLSDSEMLDEEDQGQPKYQGSLTNDPLSGALLGSQQNLLQYHPSHTEAIALWTTYANNIEPLIKVVHSPTTMQLVDAVSQRPESASKTEECLLFSLYHFAVYALTEEECQAKFGQSRSALLDRYNFATRQALVNASFLKTSDFMMITALVLFLYPCRYQYDPNTYWILTGVAIRISQRMGLHRDPEKMGLPPFDVQMRRRLFYQLIPLDGAASQLSGTGIGMIRDTWDTDRPWNIHDEQIWPGMTEPPEEQKGATDMIFCLTRSCMGVKFFATPAGEKGTASMYGNGIRGSRGFKDMAEVDLVIDEAESEVEEKYIRYCDMVNPLHVLTIGLARSGICAMRLRIRLTRIKDNTATVEEKKEMVRLAQKILDTDSAAYNHGGVRKYLWHVKDFFAWGSWDSLVYILQILRTPGLLNDDERDGAWSRIEQVYNNHSELLLQANRALQVAIGRLALGAWNANPPSNCVPDPGFIATLRLTRRVHMERRAGRDNSSGIPSNANSAVTPTLDQIDENAALACGDTTFDIGSNFDNSVVDWMFWEQMFQDYQTQGAQ